MSRSTELEICALLWLIAGTLSPHTLKYLLPWTGNKR